MSRRRDSRAGRLSALAGAGLLAFASAAFGIDEAAAVTERDLTGAELFEACAGCHALAPGAAHRNGPNLWGIGGRRAGTREGFTYSEALSSSGFTWNRGTLTAWILATDVVLPGTWMVYHNTLAPAEVNRLVSYILDTPAD